ncbi:trehalose-6-phosphate synthase [Gregarina niphandrodes]|uniref:Trehalose-6-phosphate synthase n=1 Tax=Gregarina niphandrodes TaxID=110365 RepID=A0A023BAL4_GRENI|nr:trehalose-6-phosphate synthase [Gregarina niphandrodes]EZG78415.1 trehalose-6-phosphate synthase [Gregarina niphandrodes]|eukprot:XP_011129314.1 trehalose-6-phosphate synthase [Gregarina niphandrodes]
MYNAYVEANQEFGRVVKTKYFELKQQNPSEQILIWVHDYHLMLLPRIIRQYLNGDNQHGDNQNGDNQHGDNEHGDNEHGDNQHGDNQHGDNQHGDNQHGDNQHGDNQHGDNQHGDNHHDNHIGNHNGYDSDLQIGFFLHTTFPHPCMWRRIKERNPLLLGMLCSDLIGFHIYSYKRSFMDACQQLLDVKLLSSHIDARGIGGCKSLVKAMPIGIDPYKFVKASSTSAQKLSAEKFKEQYQGRLIVLGVDRLDYMKGIYQKLRGYQKFLEMYPDIAMNTVLVQLAVPSRGEVECYKKLKTVCHTLVGEINGKYRSPQSVGSGTSSGPFVEFLDQSVQFKQLLDLYISADVCLISSVRDGMNLVACEFVASQSSQTPGVLVMSQFVGADRSLAYGAVSMNPWSPSAIADALYHALTLSPEAKQRKAAYGRNNVIEFSAENWANTFVKYLVTKPEPNLGNIPRPLNIQDLIKKVKQTNHIRIVVNLDEIKYVPTFPMVGDEMVADEMGVGDEMTKLISVLYVTHQDPEMAFDFDRIPGDILTPTRYRNAGEWHDTQRGASTERLIVGPESIGSSFDHMTTNSVLEGNTSQMTSRVHSAAPSHEPSEAPSEVVSSNSSFRIVDGNYCDQIEERLVERCDMLTHSIRTVRLGNFIQVDLELATLKSYIWELLAHDDDVKIQDVSNHRLWIHHIDDLPEVPELRSFTNPPSPDTLVITIGIDVVHPPSHDLSIVIQYVSHT